jgi:hypothetical protein
MRYSCLFFLFFLFCYQPAEAQKIQYGGMQQMQLNFGEKGLKTGFTLINGVRFWRMFTGIGADAQYSGNNFYRNTGFNTSALFADARYYINKKRNFFAKADGGVNLITQYLPATPGTRYQKRTGYYTAFGLGFKARIGKELFYSFDVSYCMRQTRYNQDYQFYSGEWRSNRYDLRQYTLLVNLGFEIF